MSRLLAQKLQEHFKQSFVIDSRPGAGGVIGSELVARAAADGYTLLMTTPPLVINAALNPKVGYHPVRDYTPISMIASVPVVLAVHPTVAAKNVKDLIALAKSKPLNYGSAGSGTAPHLAGELFAINAGVSMTHVAYKGGTPSLVDLAGGQVQLSCQPLPSLPTYVKAGRVRTLGVGTLQRTRLADRRQRLKLADRHCAIRTVNVLQHFNVNRPLAAQHGDQRRMGDGRMGQEQVFHLFGRT